MKKIYLKLIAIMLICLLTFSLIYSVSATDMSSMITTKFNGTLDGNVQGTEPIKNILSAILGIVRTIGATVAIVVLMIIGTKYIIASAGDRADIKKYAINYVIGALILFGTSGILSIVKNFVDDSIKP